VVNNLAIRPTESEIANAMLGSAEVKLIEGEDFYWEGAAFVFTERYHLRRGHCCENGCRHCPYGTKQEELRLVDAITTTTDEKPA